MDDRDTMPLPARRRGAGGLIAALLIAFVLGLVAAGAAVRHWDRLAELLHPVAIPAVPAIVAPTRIVALPAPAQPAPDDQARTDELAGRVAEIESRIDAIDARAEAASGDAERAEALLVAFAARRALDRGQPLGYLEGLLRDRFGASDAPSVALVIAASQRPVTLAGLEDGLAALSPTLAESAPDAGWWSEMRREVSSLFVVRRADVPSAIPTDRLARATRALDRGQVDAAAAEVARMPGAARASAWLASARRYLLARGALDQLETEALLKPAAQAPAN